LCWQHMPKIPVKMKPTNAIPPPSTVAKIPVGYKKITKRSLNDFFTDNQIPITPIGGIDLKLFTGPIDNSNWVIRGKLLAGCYPLEGIKTLMNIGVKDIISLQTAEELATFIPYKHLLDPDVNVH